MSLIFPPSASRASSSARHSSSAASTRARRASDSFTTHSSLIIAASAFGISLGEKDRLTTVAPNTPSSSHRGCNCLAVSRTSSSCHSSCQLGTRSCDSISSTSRAATVSTASMDAAGTSIPATVPPPACAARSTSTRCSRDLSRETSCTTWMSGCISPVTAASTSSRIAASIESSAKSPELSATCTYAESAAMNEPSSSPRCFRTTERRIASLSTSAAGTDDGDAASASASSSPGITSSTASSTNTCSTVSLMIRSSSPAARSTFSTSGSSSAAAAVTRRRAGTHRERERGPSREAAAAVGRARGGRARTAASVADAVTEMTMMFASRSTPGSLERDRLLGRASRSVVRMSGGIRRASNRRRRRQFPLALPMFLGNSRNVFQEFQEFPRSFLGFFWQTISRVDFLPECRFFKGKSARITNRKLRGRLHGVLVFKGSFWRGR